MLQRMSGLNRTGGTLGELIANDFGTIVTIAPSDAAFSSERCGTWTKIS
jgi:hypothetical protein